MPQACLHRLALGPAKAKLVARASATDVTPWRINKSAPKTSPDSLPAPLRPLFSYTLWRLYEDVNTIGGRNSCILLTNDVATSNLAKTLNISVRTMYEIRQLIASQTKVEDLDSFGDLEREFGQREPVPKSDPNWRKLRLKAPTVNNDHMLHGSQVDHKGNTADQTVNDQTVNDQTINDQTINDQTVNTTNQTINTADQTVNTADQAVNTAEPSGGVDLPASKVIIHSSSEGDLSIMDKEAVVPEIQSNTASTEDFPIVLEDQENVQEWLTTADSGVNLARTENTEQTRLDSMGHEKPADALFHVEVASAPTETETTKSSATSITPIFQPGNKQGTESPVRKDVIDTPITASDIVTDEAPTPMPADSGVPRSPNVLPERQGASPQEAENQNQHSSSPSAVSSGSVPCSPRPLSETNSLSTTEAQDEEDSDEEVVVFNPRAKRWSSHAKSIKDTPQPISPAEPLNSRKLAPGFESPPRKESSDRLLATPSPSGHAQTRLLPPNPSPRGQISGEQSPQGQVNLDPVNGEQSLRKHGPQNMSPRNRDPQNGSPRNHSPRNQGQRKQGRPNSAPQNRAPPAIIDPDFFGRSAVVNLNPNGHNGQGRYFNRNKPRRGPRSYEADVEYVLTSGSTREDTRGKGKLWVP